MSKCDHTLEEMETAIYCDSLCPACNRSRIASLETEIESDNKTIELLNAENEALRKAMELVMCYPDIRIYIGSELSGIADAAMKKSK